MSLMRVSSARRGEGFCGWQEQIEKKKRRGDNICILLGDVVFARLRMRLIIQKYGWWGGTAR
jgi:hypothetical protein